MKTLIGCSLIGFTVLCCSPTPKPHIEEPSHEIVGADAGDAGPDVWTYDDSPEAPTSPCARACAKLRNFQCKEGTGHCAAACKEAGGFVNVDCVLAANVRADLSVCNVRCIR